MIVEVNPRESPGFLIPRVSHLLRTRINRGLKDAGNSLSSEEHAVLLVLVAQGEEPIRVADLAGLLMRDPTTVKRQLDALYGAKLVAQSADPTDGRVVLLQATEKGRRVVQQTVPLLEEVRGQVLSGVTKTDLRTTVRTLQKMLKNLE